MQGEHAGSMCLRSTMSYTELKYQPFPFQINKDTHLYTLIIRPNATYEVKIDNEKVTTGALEDDWDFLPPRKIKDPYARKPRKWDERLQIEDPEDKKPEVRGSLVRKLISGRRRYSQDIRADVISQVSGRLVP